MVLFLPQSSMKHFNKRDRHAYYACHGLLLFSALAMTTALITIIIISLTVQSPYIGAAARQFTNNLRLGAILAVGFCSLGLALSTLATRWIAGKNQIGLVVVDDFDEESSLDNEQVISCRMRNNKVGDADADSKEVQSKSSDSEKVVYYELVTKIDGMNGKN